MNAISSLTQLPNLLMIRNRKNRCRKNLIPMIRNLMNRSRKIHCLKSRCRQNPNPMIRNPVW